MTPQKQTCLAVFSMAGFVVLWAAVTDAWNYSGLLFPALPGGKYLYACLSRGVWMLPVFFLLRRFEGHLFWNRACLFSKPTADPLFLLFLALTASYGLALMWWNYRAWHVTDEPLLLLTAKLLAVAVGEETVFRGWGYNLLKKVHSGRMAVVLSGVLFMLLHWPAYGIKLFLYGGFLWQEMLSQSLSALFYGTLFAAMLKRSGTLSNPVLAHFFYDWMMTVFA